LFSTILRYSVNKWISESYREYLKKRFPDKDLHHLLGSFTGMKISDSLLIPLSRKEHNEVHKLTKDEVLEMYLAKSINLLQDYIKYLKGKNDKNNSQND